MGNCLAKKVEMPPLDVESGDSILLSPSPTVNSPTTPTTPLPPCPQINPEALELCEVLYKVIALLSQSMASDDG